MTGPSTEDRLAIFELYARYSWALDTGDTDGYVALFTEDCEATEEASDGTLEVLKGKADIRRLVLKFPATSIRWRNSCSRPIRRDGPITGSCAPMPGRRSTTRPSRRISTGAAMSAMWSRKWMANG